MIQIQSQQGVILNYLKKHPNKKVSPDIFVNPFIFSSVPFIWHSASARLCELRRLWLIEKIWVKKCIKRFLRKWKDINLYQITEQGKNFIFNKHLQNEPL